MARRIAAATGMRKAPKTKGGKPFAEATPILIAR
jgi:hypothetical protein